MNLLSADSISKYIGERTLFSNLSFGLEKGDKAALIAANGTGKSSLLKILSGLDVPDAGEVAIHEGIRVGYLEQEPRFDARLTIEELIWQADLSTRKIITAYGRALKIHSENHSPESEKALESATAKMDQAGAWDFDRRMVQMLDRFSITRLDQRIDTLSGGQRKRLALALLLLDSPDLLLLDEPTNHLDIEMIEWLEGYLSVSTISYLMVTHDRYFLDRICNRILEIDNESLFIYKGNFEYFLEKKAERESAFAAEKDRANKFVRQELDWIRRMPKARGTKSKSRIDAFNAAKERAHVKKSHQDLKLEVNMKRVGGKILEIQNLSKSYGKTRILSDFSYSFTRGEKVGIIGPNGSGKTTFLNLITGREKADKGIVSTGETIEYGYYRQEGIRVDDSKRVIDVVTDIAEIITTSGGSKLTASQFLQYFLFPPEKQYDIVGKLSGGEKRRLYLLTVLVKNPNFLILDEPTNDLDIITLSKLEQFLISFSGCLILVSHDRYLLDRLADHLLVFEGDGKIVDYYGNYQDYTFEKEQQAEDSRRETQAVKEMSQGNKSTEAATSVRHKRSYKEKLEYERLGEEIAALEKEKKELEALLNSAQNDYEILSEASERIGKVIGLIDDKTMRWLELDEMGGN